MLRVKSQKVGPRRLGKSTYFQLLPLIGITVFYNQFTAFFHLMTRLSWSSAPESRGDQKSLSVSFLSPWRQSENFYAVPESKIASLKMEERRGSHGAEEYLRGGT